jgi:hypothetical protein
MTRPRLLRLKKTDTAHDYDEQQLRELRLGAPIARPSYISCVFDPNGVHGTILTNTTCPHSFFAAQITALRKLPMNHVSLYASSKWPRAV